MTRPVPIQKTFCRNVARTLQDHAMVSKKEGVLIGISGGPDSMALARVLMHLAPDRDLHLGLAHLNHGLRGESSDRDQAFIQQFAAMSNLPFFCEYRDVAVMAKQSRTSVEEAGRNARYAFFNQVADTCGFSRIATGHTRDDNAEQVLIGLLRGSGSKGLAGIPPVRENRFIRPLIDRSRQEILGFLEDLDQAYVMDDSNQDPAFLRNRIRTQLLPILEKDYNPGIKQGLHRLSTILFHEDQFLDDHAARAFAGCVEKTPLETVVLSIPAVNRLHPALVPRVLRCAIHTVKSTLRQITRDHIRAIQDMVATAAPGKHLDLPGRIRVYKTRDRIIFKKEAIPLRQLGRMQKQAKRLPPEA
jgi:tRNA(Ile)-lysidine synthase